MAELVTNPWGENESDSTVPTLTLQIYNYIDQYLGRKEIDTHVNRASSANMCPKRRWYQRTGIVGEKLTPRKLVNFLLGDLSEKTVQHFIKEGCVGPGKLYSQVQFGTEIGSFTIQSKKISVYTQEDLTAQIGDIEVTAHVDGWGKRNSDGRWELIEIKSAADYGFESFKESGPGNYLNQAMVNLKTSKAIELGATQVRFIYLKKNTGNLYDSLHEFDAALFKDVVEEYKIAASDVEPKRPYAPVIETFRSKPTGRKKLFWACSYCPYTQRCWPEAELEIKSGKPVWYLKEEKTNEL